MDQMGVEAEATVEMEMLLERGEDVDIGNGVCVVMLI